MTPSGMEQRKGEAPQHGPYTPESPQGTLPTEEMFKAPYLEHIYSLLQRMSENSSSDHEEEMEIDFSSIRVLSDALFGTLDEEFARSMVPSSDSESQKSFLLRFRCCFVVLHQLEFDLTLVMEKTRVLLGILRQVKRLEEDSGSSTPFRCLFLEVIADCMLLHKHSAKHLKVADLLWEEQEKTFSSHNDHSDVSFIMDLLCIHFILFFNGKKGLDKLYSSLFWSCGSEMYHPLVSLPAILTLLGNTFYFSLPRIIQTHTLLLASACIGTSLSSAYQDSNDLFLNYYMVTFALSVDLYRRMILADVKLDSDPLESVIASGDYFGLSFESSVQPRTQSRIEQHVSDLEEWYHNDFQFSTSENNIDKEVIVMAYVKENEHIIQSPFREEVLLFLKSITSISNLRTDCYEKFDALVGNDWQALFHVAAILKLMSSSLLHIFWIFNQTSMCDGKRQKNGASFIPYDCLREIFLSFIHSGVNSIHRHMSDVLKEPCSAEYKERTETKMMVIHFVCLFLYSVNRGITCLWKCSIFMLVVLLNFAIYDYGNAEALNILNCITRHSASAVSLSKTSFRLSQHKSNQGIGTSITAIASRFQKIQALHLKKEYLCLTNEINSLECGTRWDVEEGVERTENPPLIAPLQDGVTSACSMTERDIHNEVYLRCIGCGEKDVDELADFIDYTPGKDYIDWMKSKKKFRDWKAGKSLVSRRRRRKKTWALLRKATQKRK